MKIIYIGDFKQSYATERYIAEALKELGHEVNCVQEDGFIVRKAEDALSELKVMQPDFILFSKGKPYGEATKLIELLKKEGIKTVCWLFDLYFGLPEVAGMSRITDRLNKLKAKEAPYNAEILVTTDGGHDKEFKELGFNHHCIRQGIHEPEAQMYHSSGNYDIVFVGGDYFRNRGWLIEGLKERYGTKFKWVGNIIQVRGLKLNTIYAETKIVVGDSQPSPNYWSNRIYETLGRGGFLIHPRVDGLEKEFTNGEHLVLFERGNMEELFKLIDYYLTHKEEREKIRKAGFEHVKNNYTYKHRCQELLKLI